MGGSEVSERRRLGFALTARQPVGFFSPGEAKEGNSEANACSSSGLDLSFLLTRLSHAAAIRKSFQTLRHPLHRFFPQKYPVIIDADFLPLYTHQTKAPRVSGEQQPPSEVIPAFLNLRYRASDAPVDGNDSAHSSRSSISSLPWRDVPAAVPRDELSLRDDVRCVLLQLFVYGSFVWIPALIVWIWRKHCTTRRRKVILILAVLSLVFFPLRPKPAIRTWRGWNHFHRYHRTAAVVERLENFPPRDPTIYAVFPHGIIPTAPAAMATAQFGNLLGHFRLTAASIVRWCLLYGQLIFLGDAIAANRQSMKGSLEEGVNLLVSPGGIAEMYEMSSKQERVHLQERQGVVRIAMETGARLVPVYCFGHSQAYRLFWGVRFLQPVARLLRVALVFFYGRFGLPVAFRVPLLYAFGRPLQIPQMDKPTRADVASAHQQLVSEVQRIFDTYKCLYGWEDKRLEIL
ncbi:hypothetical protein Efla_006415 [Eimeria flavescens]